MASRVGKIYRFQRKLSTSLYTKSGLAHVIPMLSCLITAKLDVIFARLFVA